MANFSLAGNGCGIVQGMRLKRSFPTLASSLVLGFALAGATAALAKPLPPLAPAGGAQDVTGAVKHATKSTTRTTKQAYHKTERGTKQAYKTTKKGTKKAYHATKNGTKKTYKATKNGTKKAYHKTKNTTMGAAKGAKEGAKK